MSEKLQKVLAAAGLGSRRGLEKWIVDGRIKVNGKMATLGDRVDDDDTIHVDDRKMKRSEKNKRTRVIIYNKPVGEICSRNDPEGRPTVFAKLPALSGERWVSVGRLDINTSGLLLFTNNGELANVLMHPSTGMDREYLVRVHGDVTEEMTNRLLKGVQLEDGFAKFTDIVAGESTGANSWYTVALTEGRNREVRRLWESQEVEVNRLKRVRFGPVFFPSFLAVGQWVDLEPKEVQALCRKAGFENFSAGKWSPSEQQDQERRIHKLRSKGR